MLFVEPKFFLFFGVVLSVYWSLRSNNYRKWFLLAASYVFYGSWNWHFAIMLFFLSWGDFYFARKIGQTTDPVIRKRYVFCSLAMNLGVLGYFKYCNFFISSAVGLSNLVGVHLDQPTLSIILPIGVSFFTFQSLSYTIDVYRGEIIALKHPRDYILFAAFFPQLVAGPIVRAKYFLPQLESIRTLTLPAIKSSIVLFVIGFIKKECIADNISPYVDAVFAAPAAYSNLAVITAAWLYAVQIFCDFSGYTDMAISVARLMGYELTINFNAPYLATSIQDFWRRWHISLSTWIRDYIYISLGGRSSNRFVTARNVMITMLAGGLWHGPAWTFVTWGGLHGAAQVVQREFKRTRLNNFYTSQVRTIISWFITIQFVCICWILFRAPSFNTALQIILRYFFLKKGGVHDFPYGLTLLPIILLFVQYLFSKFGIEGKLSRLSGPYFNFGLGLTIALILAFLPFARRPFIYFQF